MEIQITEKKKQKLPRRERLRDWPIRAWAFACEVVGDMPTWIKSTEELQRQLWNDMAFELKRQVAPHRIAGSDPDDVVKAKQDARNAIVKQFKDTKFLRAFGQKYRGQITSDCYYAVVDRFLLALKEWPARRQRAKAAKGYTSWEMGMPSPKYLDREFNLNLPVNFNAVAGQETTWADLYGEGGNVSLYRLPEAAPGAKHNLEFRVKTPQGADVKLRHLKLLVSIHRLPPPHAIVKRVTLVRQSERGFRDRYEIQFSLEMPPLNLPREMTGRVAGYDSGGWRLMGDRVRVGVLTDNAGHSYEIAMPFDFSSRADKKCIEPKKKDVRRLVLLSEQTGDCVENCKQALKAIYDRKKDQWPEEARQTMLGFTKMRQGGLERLREKLEGTDLEAASLLWKLALIIDWLHHKKRALELEFAQLKEEVYKQVAAWIMRSFDIVAWEGDLSLKQMAEAGAGDPSQKYRQLVGQYYLRERIKQAAQKFRHDPELDPKNKGALRNHKAAYSTQTCSECGGKVEKGRKLLRVCENGHKQDNDVNTSRLLLSEIEGGASISASPVEIPDHLRRYVRVMAASEMAIEVG
jgi:hypothetical protein